MPPLPLQSHSIQIITFINTCGRVRERLCKTYGGDVKMSGEMLYKKKLRVNDLQNERSFSKKKIKLEINNLAFYPTANVLWKEREKNLCVEPSCV